MKTRLVIVEDDPAIRECFEWIFDPEKYDIATYSNGDEILRNQVQEVDLFMIDKQLSGVDGLDICRFLKSQPETKDIPVIIISASPNIKGLSLQAGAHDTLEKPFHLRTLREMVNKYAPNHDLPEVVDE